MVKRHIDALAGWTPEFVKNNLGPIGLLLFLGWGSYQGISALNEQHRVLARQQEELTKLLEKMVDHLQAIRTDVAIMRALDGRVEFEGLTPEDVN